ncbi:MAG: 1,4-alpha-glucan branching protein GlgB, partial [Gammaproteobacteria bacterium]|nr:1,4-alpha-glucan branching protein GlgB [Gammaproteobacteria bacterium]
SDFFEWHGAGETCPERYRFQAILKHGGTREFWDPYAFPPQVGDLDLHLFAEGRHRQAWRFLGARPWRADGIDGVLFATWAPNAARVSVVGDFNHWDGRRHPMRSRGGSGVWELFIPELGTGALYKFELVNRTTGDLLLKTDPYGRQFEFRPATAAIVEPGQAYEWRDAEWLSRRAGRDWLHAPMTVYEVHLGSWQRDSGNYLTYRQLAERLVPYVVELGFTHIELLPVFEHPYDGSWGYQCTGYFAPTSRHGTVDDFRRFVDACHAAGLGVLLDWVPGHFPRDSFALARFDGTPLYEHADPRRGEHRDWGTLIFDYGRNEVRNFLISSALFWLEEMHVDGLRVDAVASMIYLDYSRDPGDWTPNVHGGRENLEAVAFLRELNELVHDRCPGALVIAEESTSWPQVSRPTSQGGLGFSMKWNMGWMNDTLDYFAMDPVHRKHHHDKLTFGLVYAFSENFVLPLSHDEVVHGKRALLDKMPGDDWQRLANLRLLLTYMYTLPGKKLLFMGSELAQKREWNENRALDWELLDHAEHRGVRTLVQDLNRLVLDHPALHVNDFDRAGFHWLDCEDADRSILAFMRASGSEQLLVCLNFTPVPRRGYRVGVPEPGSYLARFNSDSRFYEGGDFGSSSAESEPVPCMGQPHSLVLDLPPLAGLVLGRA